MVKSSTQTKLKQRNSNHGSLVHWAVFLVIWVAAGQVMKTPLTRTELLVRDLEKSAIILLVWGVYAIATKWKRVVRPLP